MALRDLTVILQMDLEKKHLNKKCQQLLFKDVFDYGNKQREI